jgi:cytochrome c oxidase subunit II
MTFTVFAAADGPITQNLSIFDPASPPAEAIRALFILVGAITGGIFLLVEGILIYSLIRSRRSRGPGDTNPPQVYGSQPIEIAWTAGPTLIVFVLMLVVARTEWEVRAADPDRPPPGSQPLKVTVVGRQWWWELRYTNFDGKDLGFTTANELHVPASEDGTPRPVYLELQSADVCHSFWVPRLAGKTDLIPNRVNRMWFETKHPGLYLGQCAEYCGTQHAGMLLRVVVESQADFEKWCEEQKKPAVEDPTAGDGKAAFLGQSCVNCHAVRGTPAVGTYAPNLTHLMSRQTIASGMIPNSPENLKAWVNDPQQLKEGCLMPAFALSEKDLDLVVKYLTTLK